MLASMWIALAVLVLIASFGAAWWFSLLSLALAWAARRYRNGTLFIVSALAAVGSAMLWIALIPSTTGSEPVLVILAIVSVAIAVISARRLTKLGAAVAIP